MSPQVQPRESRSEYVSRCVQELKREDPNKPTQECLGKCYGMWKSAHPGGDMMSKDAKKVIKE